MPLAYNTENYMWGKGRLFFQKDGTSGLLDLGNCPEFALNIEVTKDDHYSSRSGVRTKDLSPVTEKMCTGSITLEEFSPENLDLAFFGDGVVSGAQSAGTIDASETTTVADRYVELGYTDLYYTKLSHGTVSGGPFTVGETVTGGTSSATGKVAWVAATYVEIVSLSGTFQSGESISGGTSSASATLSGVETMNGAVVTDAAAATARYTAGTDYDVDYVGGMIRERSGGSIAANTAYVSADYSAKTQKSVRALANSSTGGKLVFIGDPDYGPRLRVDCWDVDVTIGGDIGFISESIAQMTLALEVLDDSTNHPNEPFFRVREDS